MIHHIIATIGLFFSVYGSLIFWKGDPQILDFIVTTVGWTTFIAAMWIF